MLGLYIVSSLSIDLQADGPASEMLRKFDHLYEQSDELPADQIPWLCRAWCRVADWVLIYGTENPVASFTFQCQLAIVSTTRTFENVGWRYALIDAIYRYSSQCASSLQTMLTERGALERIRSAQLQLTDIDAGTASTTVDMMRKFIGVARWLLDRERIFDDVVTETSTTALNTIKMRYYSFRVMGGFLLACKLVHESQQVANLLYTCELMIHKFQPLGYISPLVLSLMPIIVKFRLLAQAQIAEDRQLLHQALVYYTEARDRYKWKWTEHVRTIHDNLESAALETDSLPVLLFDDAADMRYVTVIQDLLKLGEANSEIDLVSLGRL